MFLYIIYIIYKSMSFFWDIELRWILNLCLEPMTADTIMVRLYSYKLNKQVVKIAFVCLTISFYKK